MLCLDGLGLVLGSDPESQVETECSILVVGKTCVTGPQLNIIHN